MAVNEKEMYEHVSTIRQEMTVVADVPRDLHKLTNYTKWSEKTRHLVDTVVRNISAKYQCNLAGDWKLSTKQAAHLASGFVLVANTVPELQVPRIKLSVKEIISAIDSHDKKIALTSGALRVEICDETTKIIETILCK